MNKIEIVKNGITHLGTDTVVNAANEGLWQGNGVCGAIFAAAGAAELTKACDAIGHCDTGKAVITPAFKLDAKYIIHAVGPRWHGGKSGEREQLYGAYASSLELAVKNGCRSIGFPLISAGIFGYPLEKAWQVALEACTDFLKAHADCDLTIRFGVPDAHNRDVGEKMLEETK